MRVKILRNPGSALMKTIGDDVTGLAEGDVAELPDSAGKALVDLGIAEIRELPPIKAVPDSPKIKADKFGTKQ